VSRVWLTCAIVTAAVVAAVFIFTSLTDRPAAEADGQRPPKAPPPLSEQEVRTYLDVMPEIRSELGHIVNEYQRERIRNNGKVDDAGFQIKTQSLIDSILERSHLTRETWHPLSERVEYAVNVLRAEAELEKARPEMEQRLKLRKAALATAASDDDRPAAEKEIRDLEARLAGKGQPLSPQDRDLIRQYWSSLDAAVPPRGPPQRAPK